MLYDPPHVEEPVSYLAAQPGSIDYDYGYTDSHTLAYASNYEMYGHQFACPFMPETGFHDSYYPELGAFGLDETQCSLLSQVLAPIVTAYTGWPQYAAYSQAECNDNQQVAEQQEHDAGVQSGGVKRLKKRRQICEDAAKRLHQQLRNAAPIQNLQKMTRKYDTDRSGRISITDFKKFVRKDLRIGVAAMVDADIDALAASLDVDCSESVPIDEVIEFIERGTAAFLPASEQQPQPEEITPQQQPQVTLPVPRAANRQSPLVNTRTEKPRLHHRATRPWGEGSRRSAPAQGGAPMSTICTAATEGKEGQIPDAEHGGQIPDFEHGGKDEKDVGNGEDGGVDPDSNDDGDNLKSRGAKKPQKVGSITLKRRGAGSGRSGIAQEGSASLLYLPLGPNFIQVAKKTGGRPVTAGQVTSNRQHSRERKLPNPQSARGAGFASVFQEDDSSASHSGPGGVGYLGDNYKTIVASALGLPRKKRHLLSNPPLSASAKRQGIDGKKHLLSGGFALPGIQRPSTTIGKNAKSFLPKWNDHPLASPPSQ